MDGASGVAQSSSSGWRYPTLTFVTVARRWPSDFCSCCGLVQNTNTMVLCTCHSCLKAELYLTTCLQLYHWGQWAKTSVRISTIQTRGQKVSWSPLAVHICLKMPRSPFRYFCNCFNDSHEGHLWKVELVNNADAEFTNRIHKQVLRIHNILFHIHLLPGAILLLSKKTQYIVQTIFGRQ